MSHVLLIGATGGIGSRLLPMLVARGHVVTALHRSADQADDLRAAGATPVMADLMEITPEQLTKLATGQDIIVFSAGAAGSGADRTAEIDGKGPVKCIEAAQASGAHRLYLVSAMPESGREQMPKTGFEFYMKTKKEADAALAASDLDWVILRPGTLQDAEADGAVTLSRAVTYGRVKRGNVAAVLAELIEQPGIRREILELTDGDTPLTEAVAALRR